jgi:methyl-accepting chemotaxis protein
MVAHSQSTSSRPGTEPERSELWLLRPGLWLNDRLRTSARLLTLLVLLLIPGLLASWSFASAMGSQISFTHLERAGLVVLEPTLNAAAGSAQGQPVDLSKVTAAVAAHDELGLGPALKTLQQAASGTGPAPAQALADFATEVGNASNLILDPDLDSFYLMDMQVVQFPKALIAIATAAAATGSTSSTSSTSSTGSTGSIAAASAVAVNAGQLLSAGQAIGSDLSTAQKNTGAPGALADLGSVSTSADGAQQLAKALTASLETPATLDPSAAARSIQAALHPAALALGALMETREAGFVQRRNITLAITALGFLLAVYFGFVTWWRTRGDVGATVSAVAAIADGRLEPQPLPRGRDELGDIARSLERARHTLATQAEQLGHAQLERQAQLEAGFVRQQAAERQVRARAQGIIDETAATVVGELTELIAEVDAVRRSAGTIEERVGAAEIVTRSVVQRAAAADQGAVALGDSLRQVAGMTQLISRVAAQTKLLALNATIEAARAGAAGRGFSVVADEVKTLAATTAESTGQITSTLATLESDASDVAAAITGVGENIASLDEATTALSDVVTEQYALVARLDAALAATLARVADLSTLTEQLERRQHERRPVSGTATLTLDATTTVEAVLVDLSTVGLRCTIARRSGLRPGQPVAVELSVGRHRIAIGAIVVREDANPDQSAEISLQFSDPDVATEAAVAAILHPADQASAASR